MKEYYMSLYWWPDTITENQKEYWTNGNLKVKYENIGQNKKLKKEYFEEGRLKLTVEVSQVYAIDTCLVEEPKTWEIKEVVEKGFTDIADGEYIEYHEPIYSPEDIPIAKGYYRNGKRIGQWEIEISNKNIYVVANFNTQGQLEGQYIEYFLEYGKEINKIKWLGQYNVVPTIDLKWDHQLKKYKSLSYMESRKVGVWQRFNELGELKETVTYEMKD